MSCLKALVSQTSTEGRKTRSGVSFRLIFATSIYGTEPFEVLHMLFFPLAGTEQLVVLELLELFWDKVF